MKFIQMIKSSIQEKKSSHIPMKENNQEKENNNHKSTDGLGRNQRQVSGTGNEKSTSKNQTTRARGIEATGQIESA